MLEGFYKETKPMSEYEENVLLPVMVRCLTKHVGEETIITNKQMCKALKASGYEASEARLRKVIHFIRTEGLVKRLIATNRGYFVAKTKEELMSHIQSLIGREDAIREARTALEEQCDDWTETLVN